MCWLLLCLLLFVSSCNDDKIVKLESEKKALIKQLDDAKHHVDLDTQEKCSNAAQRFFKREYQADKGTILLTQHNHYNQTLGKCFVLIEWHYNGGGTGSWYNVMTIHDAYENESYGSFSEYNHVGADYKTTASIYNCQVQGSKCSSVDQFNQQVQQFMSN
jgi:hypothetical protein